MKNKNKEQEKESRKCIRNKEISIEPRVCLAFGDWLTGYTAFLVKGNVSRDVQVTKFQC